MSFLRLIRFPNLIIVALTQFLLYYQLIFPTLQAANIMPTLSAQQFYLFVLVTLLITAGGYIINDLIDVEIDLLNKPERVIIGQTVSHQTAYWLYFVLNLAGFVLSFSIAFSLNRMQLLFIFPTAVLGLLAYSLWLKKRPLSGNVLISVYCAGVAAVVCLAELPALEKLPSSDFQQVVQLLLFYLVFAFLSTLFREIIKDMEDKLGDAQGGARTAPIVWGMRISKAIGMSTGVLLLLFMGYVCFALHQTLALAAFIFMIILAILIIIAAWLLYNAKHKLEFHRLSQFAKIIMLGGVLMLLFF